MPFNYVTVQGLINFGRSFASELLGQPFIQYRLTGNSSGDLIVPTNEIANLSIKIKPRLSRSVIENYFFNTNAFEFLMSSDVVQVGDILVQNDPVYSGDSTYAIASLRPLMPVLAIRVGHTGQIYHADAGWTQAAGGYSGHAYSTQKPYILQNGIYQVGDVGQTPSNIPMSIVSVAHMRGMSQAENLPLDIPKEWWYGYLPLLPGLNTVRMGDFIQASGPIMGDVPQRYQVANITPSPAGMAGNYYVLEYLTP